MAAITKTFTKKELIDELGLPNYPEDRVVVLSDKFVDKSRWADEYELVFRTKDMPETDAWMVYYRVGATEQQDERPWEYDDTVEAWLVREQIKEVKVWECVDE